MEFNKKNRLILIKDSMGFPRLGEKRECYWIFLSRNYGRLVDLRAKQPEGFKFMDIGAGLNETAINLRRPYLDYIGALSRRFASLPWWISRVAEKNVMISPVFLYVCYLDVVGRFLDNDLKGKDVCVFCESSALLETIARGRISSERRVCRDYKYFANQLFGLIKAVVRCAGFIVFSMSRSFDAFFTRLTERAGFSPIASSLTIMRTWVSEKDLGADGKFNDAYFKGLSDHLKTKGIKVAILPIIYNVRRSYFDAVSWLRRSSDLFIIPEDYYRASDYFKAIILNIRSLGLFLNRFRFGDRDLTLIFREDALRNTFNDLSTQIVMHYYLMKRLRQKQVKIDRVLLTFENMFPEKPLILGVKEFLPGTKTFGFQHASLFPLLLSSYTSSIESNVLPMPDRIVCSGRFFMETLAREGFPPQKLVLGPALRFQYLLADNRPAALLREDAAMITLPLAKSSALELLVKTSSAKPPALALWLKPHPMMPNAELREIIRKSGIDSENYRIVGGGMADLLPRVKMLIATASATIFDAIAAGVPVVRVRSDVDISLDPMDWFPKDELQFTARTSRELASEIDRALSLDETALSRLKKKGAELVEACFFPVSEKSLAAFYEDIK